MIACGYQKMKSKYMHPRKLAIVEVLDELLDWKDASHVIKAKFGDEAEVESCDRIKDPNLTSIVFKSEDLDIVYPGEDIPLELRMRRLVKKTT